VTASDGVAAKRTVRMTAPVVRQLVVFWDLYLMQLANFRWTWRWQVIGGLVAPLSFMFMLNTLLERPAGTAEAVAVGAHILAGNLVMSTVFTTMGHTASRFAWLKETEGLDYYATRPIDRAMMVAAVLLAFITLGLPNLLATVALGKLLFALPLSPHPLALLAILLAALALASVGAMVGILAPDQTTQQVADNLLLFAMLFLSPVLIPVERLPPLLQWTSTLLPTSYVVDALRQLLVGVVDGGVVLDLVVLAGFSAAALLLATRRLDWRGR
jgi:ABC-2 type transport system permease protein